MGRLDQVLGLGRDPADPGLQHEALAGLVTGHEGYEGLGPEAIVTTVHDLYIHPSDLHPPQ